MLLMLQVAATLLAAGPADTVAFLDRSPRPSEQLADLRWEPAVASQPDTNRPRAIEYSNAYGVRLTIHSTSQGVEVIAGPEGMKVTLVK